MEREHIWNKAKSYWIEELKEFNQMSMLRGDKEENEDYYGTLEWNFDQKLSKRLCEIVNHNPIGIHMIMLSALYILLGYYSSENDFIIYSPVAASKKEALQVNQYIPLRGQIRKGMTFRELLSQVKETVKRGYEYQYVAVKEVFDEQRQLSSILLGVEAFHDLELWNEIAGNLKTKLNLAVSEQNGNLMLNLMYDQGTYSEEMMKRIAKTLEIILGYFAKNAQQKIEESSLIDSESLDCITGPFNRTEMVLPEEESVYRMFEKQASRRKDKVAVVAGEEKCTYEELLTLTARYARILYGNHVTRKATVGILLEPGIETLAVILAVLKLGAAYLPIDIRKPKNAIQYIQQDTKDLVIVTRRNIKEEKKLDGFCILLEEAEEEKEVPQVEYDRNDILYVLYTSGSTGKPKGVEVLHKNAINFIYAMKEKIDFCEEKSILSLTSLSFDISFLETILALTLGLKVVIAKEEGMDLRKLEQLIVRNQINMLQCTPTRMRSMLNGFQGVEWFQSLTEILLGGEMVDQQLFLELRNHTNAPVYNMYGPTETTIWSTMKELHRKESVNIGKPIGNTKVYIVDSNLHLKGIQAVGELCIAGSGVSKGYRNQLKLTKEKFIKNPFCKESEQEKEPYLYRTGDMAYWKQDGTIELIGRIDQQVKINGYRIELGEIEAYLNENDKIEQAAVIARKGEKNSYLEAFYIAREELTTAKLREQLKENLPEYMIPSYFIRIDQMPVTVSGKRDNQKLQELADNILKEKQRDSDEEHTTIQKRLIKIWKEVLETDTIGIHDNFFEIGGSSLLLMEMIAKANQEFPCGVSVSDSFTAFTIADMEKQIISSQSTETEQALHYLILPEEYYIEKTQTMDIKVLSTVLQNTELEWIRNISKSCQVEEKDVWTGLFGYLLSEVTGDASLEFLNYRGKNTFEIYHISLEELEEMEELFQMINRQRKSRNYKCGVETLERSIHRIKKQIIPVFIINKEKPVTFYEQFGFWFQVCQMDRNWVLVCQYDDSQLQEQKIETLMKAYIKLIRMVGTELV